MRSNRQTSFTKDNVGYLLLSIQAARYHRELRAIYGEHRLISASCTPLDSKRVDRVHTTKRNVVKYSGEGERHSKNIATGYGSITCIHIELREQQLMNTVTRVKSVSYPKELESIEFNLNKFNLRWSNLK